jgi:hypothetical protein
MHKNAHGLGIEFEKRHSRYLFFTLIPSSPARRVFILVRKKAQM